MTQWEINGILASRLRLLYRELASYSGSGQKPPRRLKREISLLEARIYEESYGTEISEGG